MVDGSMPPSVHLFVLSHGLWGQPSHLDRLQQRLEELLPARLEQQEQEPQERIEWLNCTSNAWKRTYDGVDTCGSRLVKDALDKIQQLNQSGCTQQSGSQGTQVVTKISFIGYSLGGLITRYAVGKLYVLGLFDQVQPVNFITIATPHLGSFRRPTSFWASFFNFHVPLIASRTGRQLMLSDTDYKIPWLEAQQQHHDRLQKEQQQQQQQGPQAGQQLTTMQGHAAALVEDMERLTGASASGKQVQVVAPEPSEGGSSSSSMVGGRRGPQVATGSSSNSGLPQMLMPPGCDPKRPVPLLLLMAHPSGPFYKALAAFQARICAANIKHDASVPYCTAAISLTNPYDDSLPVSICPQYPSVVRPAAAAEQPQPVHYKGRSRMLLLPIFLPLLPALYAYLLLTGWLHHRSTRGQKIDLSWLQQHAADLEEQLELLGTAANPFSRQGSSRTRQQQQQQDQQQQQQQVQAALASSITAAAAETCAAGGGFKSLPKLGNGDHQQQQQQQQQQQLQQQQQQFDGSLQPGAAPAPAAAVSSTTGSGNSRPYSTSAIYALQASVPGLQDPPAPTAQQGPVTAAALLPPAAAGATSDTVARGSLYQAALAAVLQHRASEDDLARLEQLSRQQLDALTQPQQQQQQHVAVAAEAEPAPADAAAGTSVEEHDGIVEQPLLLHQQQEWMVQQLYDHMPPCCTAGRCSGLLPSSSSSSSLGSWQRVDVCTRHFHAHAAIMVRDRRFEAQSRDLFDFLAEQCVL